MSNYPSADRSTTEPLPVANSSPNSNAKNIAIGALAVLLLGTWGYHLYNRSETEELRIVDQTKLTTAMSSRDSVQSLYTESLTRLDSVTGNNNNLQGQLADNQADITKLKNEINKILRNKNATAAEINRAKLLIASLNSKIGGLETEVARLSGENQQLSANIDTLRTAKQTLETDLQTTRQTAAAEKEALSQTIDVGSTFNASNIQIVPVQEKGSKEKQTTTAKRVDKLLISFDVENRIAPSGPADLYVVVTAPSGKVISDAAMGSGTLTTRTEGDKTFTYRTTIEYEKGSRKNVQVPLRQSKFETGDYRIEIFQNGFKIAEGTRSLKKGGLFG